MQSFRFACILLAIGLFYPLTQHQQAPAPDQQVREEPTLVPIDLIAQDHAMFDESREALERDGTRLTTKLALAAFSSGEALEQDTTQSIPKLALAVPSSGVLDLPDNFGEPRPRIDNAVSEQSIKPQDLSYLADYAYSEVPPDQKPADTVLAALKDVPIGTPAEEIQRAADAFGLDPTFMKAVAKIESDFDPKQRTGSYIGLFQLSRYEFRKYGSGEITSPRDNAIAAAYKFATAAILFELQTHKKPTLSDLYLIHQQGWQGAAEHVAHPDQVAWKSMCDTDEGREKGEKWCKRAIWQNTLPAIKHIWQSVDKLTSAAFVEMWRERVNHFYSRYSETASSK